MVVDEYYHKCKNGDRIKLFDMDDNHLENTINMIKRKSKIGIIIRYGGFVDYEPYCDEEIIFGKDALDLLHYDLYLEEKKRRIKHGYSRKIIKNTK